MTANDTGYDIRSVRERGFKPHVVVECKGCTMTLQFPAVGRQPPEHVAKRAGEQPGRKVVPLFGHEVVVPAELAPAPAPFVRRFAVLLDSKLDPADVEARLRGIGTVVELAVKRPRKIGSGRYERTDYHKQRLREGMRQAREIRLDRYRKGLQPQA